MKFLMRVFASIFLVSCASTTDVVSVSPCFAMQEEAANVGREIFDRGFNSRVSYWVTGDGANTIVGLGLSYGGFDPQPYCPEGGFPILVYFDNSQSDLDVEFVTEWSRVVLKTMLRELAEET